MINLIAGLLALGLWWMLISVLLREQTGYGLGDWLWLIGTFAREHRSPEKRRVLWLELRLGALKRIAREIGRTEAEQEVKRKAA